MLGKTNVYHLLGLKWDNFKMSFGDVIASSTSISSASVKHLFAATAGHVTYNGNTAIMCCLITLLPREEQESFK